MVLMLWCATTLNRTARAYRDGDERPQIIEVNTGIGSGFAPSSPSDRAALTKKEGARANRYGKGSVQIRRSGTLSSTAAKRAVSPLVMTARPKEPPKLGSTEISFTNLPPMVNSTISLG